MNIDPAMQQISSAEMTAYWRTIDSLISGDTLSVFLATSEGIAKAKLFEQQFNYPLIGRAISVRAGYFLKQAVAMLQSGKYDACISLASGFSLLTGYIKVAVGNPAISFYDTDLANMIALRQNRLESMMNQALVKQMQEVRMLPVNIEEWTRRKTCLTKLFPSVKRPLILLEGIVYFISHESLNTLFSDLLNYDEAAVVLDYFPEDAIQKSRCFSRMYYEIGNFMPEVVKALIKQDTFSNNQEALQIIDHSPLQKVEADFCNIKEIPAKLIDQDDFFPVKLMTLAK